MQGISTFLGKASCSGETVQHTMDSIVLLLFVFYWYKFVFKYKSKVNFIIIGIYTLHIIIDFIVKFS